MYSVIHRDKVLDLRYKTIQHNEYAAYVGDILLGRVYKRPRRCWSIVSQEYHELCPIHGLDSKFRAAELLIKIARIQGILSNKI